LLLFGIGNMWKQIQILEGEFFFSNMGLQKSHIF
jgi:hypothetical protein